MWIETEIEGTANAAKGRKVFFFSAKRQDGKNLVAQEYLVHKGIGSKPTIGLAVRIQVDGERVVKVELNRRKAVMLPYGFIPIDSRQAVADTPVLHDGSSGGDLLSGEILCELEALTPLLPGNMRYAVSQADRQRLQQWGFDELKEDKQIAEPLRLTDGRVVIAGTALKGMIRQSLGALTSAPMERVGERHFTYRPNLDFNKYGTEERYVVRPALVIAERNGGWEIEIFDNARAALFVRQNAEQRIRKAAVDGVVLGEVSGIKEDRNRIMPDMMSSHSFNHRLANYKGGIDGQGLLGDAFTPPTRTYRLALVPRKADFRIEIKADLYQCYLRDQKQVLADHTKGHLAGHPLKFDAKQVSNSIEANAEFSPDQLIYVELKTDSQGKVSVNSQVVSCGHHFRYRRAYTSSIRLQEGHPRACLTPIAEEQAPESKGSIDVAPQRLTGARLLFGYARNDKTNRIGQGAFERLAGRIAINHAVTDSEPRFLGDPAKGYCIPLKILGQPKPSAWEFYLQQPKNSKDPLNTYGDLPGDPGGELAGRKFYRHQKGTDKADIEADTDETINSDQATLARFICQPGTSFRFTIRFARLRALELGALFAVLEPHRLAPEGKADDYAHKLGLGRPLGMGSVRITRRALRVRLEKDTVFLDDSALDNTLSEAIRALRGKLDDDLVRQWLDAHRMVADQRLGYPLDKTKVNGNTVQTIYAWHTAVRRAYSQLRRQESPDWSALANKINR
ncbi:CRISPR system related protein, RAMP superfamily [Thiorhodococcus drewsii AZ1]|uniref:CRISPR system related protein, RAMP superfamily n=1 Tax=Thiorhodococcus drewsii AZ1 TaxID=765913 RepID=G2DYP1_9GAMM|nr:TIGR03986 family CRISPR-associated RAMP protein [Thiorhodococcus drewsii]EGV32668.1 CRISPR system related protein, RAMP superfamily [Thiorhodococcus drewsii AZ1]